MQVTHNQNGKGWWAFGMVFMILQATTLTLAAWTLNTVVELKVRIAEQGQQIQQNSRAIERYH